MSNTDLHQRKQVANVSNRDEQRAEQAQYKSAEKDSLKPRGHEELLLTTVEDAHAAIKRRMVDNPNRGIATIVKLGLARNEGTALFSVCNSFSLKRRDTSGEEGV